MPNKNIWDFPTASADNLTYLSASRFIADVADTGEPLDTVHYTGQQLKDFVLSGSGAPNVWQSVTSNGGNSYVMEDQDGLLNGGGRFVLTAFAQLKSIPAGLEVMAAKGAPGNPLGWWIGVDENRWRFGIGESTNTTGAEINPTDYNRVHIISVVCLNATAYLIVDGMVAATISHSFSGASGVFDATLLRSSDISEPHYFESGSLLAFAYGHNLSWGSDSVFVPNVREAHLLCMASRDPRSLVTWLSNNFIFVVRPETYFPPEIYNPDDVYPDFTAEGSPQSMTRGNVWSGGGGGSVGGLTGSYVPMYGTTRYVVGENSVTASVNDAGNAIFALDSDGGGMECLFPDSLPTGIRIRMTYVSVGQENRMKLVGESPGTSFIGGMGDVISGSQTADLMKVSDPSGPFGVTVWTLVNTSTPLEEPMAPLVQSTHTASTKTIADTDADTIIPLSAASNAIAVTIPHTLFGSAGTGRAFACGFKVLSIAGGAITFTGSGGIVITYHGKNPGTLAIAVGDRIWVDVTSATTADVYISAVAT